MMDNGLYREILQLSPMGYAYHQIILNEGVPTDYLYLEVNSAFETMTGLLGAEILGKRVTEVLPGIAEDSFDWIAYYGDVALNGGERTFEQYSQALGRWYRVHAFSPESGYFVTVTADITNERMQLNELNGFFEVNLDLLCIADMNGCFVKLNPAWETVLGYSVEELLNRKFTEFVHPEDVEATLEESRRLAQLGSPMYFINRYRAKDGSYRHIEWRSQTSGTYIYAAAKDITDRLVAEQALHAEKERNELVIHGSNDGFWDWDLLSNTLYLSPRWKMQLGYEDSEIANSFAAFEALIHDEDRAVVMRTAQDYLASSEGAYDITFRMYHKDGSLRFIRARGEALRNAEGIPYRMAGSHTDVTVQMEQSQALEEHARNFRSFFETIEDLMMVGNTDGTLLYVNQATVDKLGYSHEELNRMHLLDLHPENRRAEAEIIFAEMFAGKRDYCPLPLETKDGKLLPVETRVWFGTWNGESCVFGVVKDLSVQEATLDLFHKLFENNPAPMALTDLTNNRFLKINRAFSDRLGYAPQEILGRTANELELFPREEAHAAAADMLRREGKIANIELTVRCKHGELLTGLFSGEVMDNQLERSFLTVMMDITELKQVQQELLEAKAKAEALNHAKSQFLANMSHEIRTPMNGMIGGFQLLEMTGLTAEQAELLKMSKDASASLLGIVNDILDYSKIEANKIVIDRVEFQLQNLMKEIQALYYPSIREKGLTLTSSIDFSIPEVLVGDPFRLKQVLGNLVGNAVKFTDRGTVSLSVRCLSVHEDGVREVEFEVADTGIGIAEAHLETVFDRFNQGDSSTTRVFGGTGLGLAICRGLVQQMGGHISAESRFGQGTSFRFVLPLAPGEGSGKGVDPRPTPAAPQAERRIRILVAEDDLVSGQLLRKMAEKMSWEMDLCTNGVEVVDRFCDKTFDLVIMDIHMPKLDGYSATQRIRAHEKQQGSHTPIIAMTANALTGDREKCLQAGMDDYLSKPIDLIDFALMVSKWAK